MFGAVSGDGPLWGRPPPFQTLRYDSSSPVCQPTAHRPGKTRCHILCPQREGVQEVRGCRGSWITIHSERKRYFTWKLLLCFAVWWYRYILCAENHRDKKNFHFHKDHLTFSPDLFISTFKHSFNLSCGLHFENY